VGLAVSVVTLAHLLGWGDSSPPPPPPPPIHRDLERITEQVQHLGARRAVVQAQILGAQHGTIRLVDAAREIQAQDDQREEIIGALGVIEPERAGNIRTLARSLSGIADLERQTGGAYRACFLAGTRRCPPGNRLRDSQGPLKTAFVQAFNTYVEHTAAAADISTITSSMF
jgi:hypothetical protein